MVCVRDVCVALYVYSAVSVVVPLVVPCVVSPVVPPTGVCVVHTVVWVVVHVRVSMCCLWL